MCVCGYPSKEEKRWSVEGWWDSWCVCSFSAAVFSTESVIPKSLLDSGLESSSSEEIGEREKYTRLEISILPSHSRMVHAEYVRHVSDCPCLSLASLGIRLRALVNSFA